MKLIQSTKGDASSHFTSFDYVQTDWDGPLDHVTDITLKEYIVVLGASDAAFQFCDWVQIGTFHLN